MTTTDGARERFARLYEEHGGRVLAYALRRAAPDVAADVVAETFLVAWRRLDDVPAEPLPWLLGVARRVLANRRRSEGRLERLHERAAGERPRDAPEPPDGALAAALRRLPERDREALLLVAWDGLDGRAAARAAGCTPVAFAVRLHRARGRLRRELEREEGTIVGNRTEMGSR
jgi:RNA polymerase sigma-70 factor (ECF subfamily)